jgi:hypothetical protein
MALSKGLREEIKRIQPVKGSESQRWGQYRDEMKRLSPEAVKQALDELHKSVSRQLRL